MRKESDLNKIEKSKKITHCYILKNGSYYRPNSCGYTEVTSRAGIYTKEDAVKRARASQELFLIPIDNAEHNKMILEEIQELSSRVI